ncbi:hypothetical protein GFGA_1c1316 [Gluconobacter frateurii NBRC 103465]|nr:hypothetical protein GFGA_1c1316 [Gluconobacter frateurii NBRC 103465]
MLCKILQFHTPYSLVWYFFALLFSSRRSRRLSFWVQFPFLTWGDNESNTTDEQEAAFMDRVVRGIDDQLLSHRLHDYNPRYRRACSCQLVLDVGFHNILSRSCLLHMHVQIKHLGACS